MSSSASAAMPRLLPAAEPAFRRRVLLLEPEAGATSGLDAQLEAAGCRVETARGPFEYLPRLAASTARIDCILTAWSVTESHDTPLVAELHKLRATNPRPLILGLRDNAAERPDFLDARLENPNLPASFQQIVRAWELACAFRDDASGPALDCDAVADLARLDGGTLLEELTSVCLASTGDYVSQARAALSAGDSRALREAAHVLKSGSGVFGARRLGGVCAALEELGNSGSLEGARFLLDQLETESQSFDRELRLLAEVNSAGPSAAANAQSAAWEGIDLAAMASVFQSRRVVAGHLPSRLDQRLGALLGAMDAHFEQLPQHDPDTTEWQLSADLVLLAGDQGESFWQECRRLRRQLPRSAFVLLLLEPSPASLDSADELRAEVVAKSAELRDVLLRSYQQLRATRRHAPRGVPTPIPPATAGLDNLAANVGRGGPSPCAPTTPYQ